jgi:apolipoprotein D and lipocalin family protein
MKPIAALLLSLALLFAATAQAADPQPLQAISLLDVPRYMGRWYEIAKFPNRFQKQCAGDTTAEYQALERGQVRVINRCRKADGTMDEAVGLARQIGDTDSAELKVRFAPRWLSFLPMVWGDYWVVDLDKDYQLAAVSEPKREYLWILSRTPQVDPERYNALLQRLRTMGLDTVKLETTRQAAGSR